MTNLTMPSTDAYWFIFYNNQLLLTTSNDPFITSSFANLQDMQAQFTRQFELGQINNRFCYCAELHTSYTIPSSVKEASLRKAFEILGKQWYNTIAKATCLIQWDTNHHYCGRCGHKTVRKSTVFERICENCSLVLYPRISPSIIVLIRNGDQLLMTRSPHFPPGSYGLVAGFVEVGENIEETVHREVMEEVGLSIKNVTYITSQPWPFPDSLMFGFMADYDKGIITPDPKEIETAGWYHYNNLPGRPSSKISIAHLLIEQFISERQAQHSQHQT